LIQGIESSSLAVTEPDGEGYVVLASLAIPAATTEVRRPKALKVVVDCSGSMAGDSIHQARDAILGTLATLTAEDHVSLTRFGNNYEHLTQGMRPFVPATALELNDKVRALDATLGGTELERALDAVLQLPPPTGQGADVLLITDGEIWELDPVVQRAAASRHRLFVIAVGSSPAEALARRIASVTKGACEFVTPGEDMAAAVRRLIAKIAAPSETLGSIRWPAEPMWTVGLGQSVFPGMTCHVFAGFAARPAGSVEIATESGSAAGLRIDLPSESSSGTTLARVAAMQRLADLGEEEAAGLAERYQLVTSYTSCAVVLERAADDKAGDAPNLRAVPQMLAAGWAATSAVSRQRFLVTGPSPPMMDYCLSVDDMGIGAPPNPRSAALPESKHRKPSVSRSPASRPPSFSAAEPTDGAWVQTLATALNDGWRTSSLNDLEDIGVPKELLEMLQAITNEEASDEPEIVVAWIAVIASGPESHRFSSSVKEELERVANPRLRARIIAAMGVIWAPNLLKPLAPKLPERP
jgi:Ca-activated chloride channel family protein